jgi:hypothetical protein
MVSPANAGYIYFVSTHVPKDRASCAPPLRCSTGIRPR